MEAVSIHDLTDVGGLAFDLIDILQLCKAEVSASTWRCFGVDCVGEQAEGLMRVAASGNAISGTELLRLASGVTQVIDGDFEAYRRGERSWWLVVRAVDSTIYVVVTENRSVLDRVKARFRDVRSSPDDATYPDAP